MANPASKEELETLWSNHNALRDAHHQLSLKHERLDGVVKLAVADGKTTHDLIIENRETRDAQHAELLKIATDLEKKVGALRTAEDQREGMKAVAKGAAVAITIAVGLIAIYRFLIG